MIVPWKVGGTKGVACRPTHLLQPGLEGVYHPPNNNYMEGYALKSWGDAVERHPHMVADTLAGTRAVPWADEPEVVDRMVTDFFDGLDVGGTVGRDRQR